MYINLTNLKNGQQCHTSDQASQRQGKQHKRGNTTCFFPLFTCGGRNEKIMGTDIKKPPSMFYNFY